MIASLLRRWALIGALAGFCLIVAVVIAMFSGPTPPGGSGERLMGLSLLLTRIGVPSSLVVMWIADRISEQSPAFWLVYPLLFLSILTNWAMAGAIIGLAVGIWRRSHLVTGS